MDGKFIVLEFLFVNCLLMEVGLATSKAQSLPSDFGTPDISFPECVHKIHGEAGQHRRNSLGNSKSGSEPDGQTESIEHEVSLSGGLSLSSDGGSLLRNIVAERHDVISLKQYLRELKINGKITIGLSKINKRKDVGIKNRKDVASLRDVTKTLWIVKGHLIRDFNKSIRENNQKKLKELERACQELHSLIKGYDTCRICASSTQLDFNEQMEVDGLIASLSEIDNDISPYLNWNSNNE